MSIKKIKVGEDEHNLVLTNALTFGDDTFDGSEAKTITLDSLTSEALATENYVDNKVASFVEKLMTPITYAELKALRDSNSLVEGMFYRITDYVCTTTQEDTRAVDNKFDIIVQALSTNTLSENASADYHYDEGENEEGGGGGGSVEPPIFIPEVLADEEGSLVDGAVTKYFDIYEDTVDGEDGTINYKTTDMFYAYDYLTNSAGVLVPVLYKSDIDIYPDEGVDYQDVFYYAGKYEMDGVTYDRWRKIEQDTGYDWSGDIGRIYALTNVIVDGDYSEGVVLPPIFKANILAWELKYSLDNDTTKYAWADETNGKGVIYWLKDEYGNECPYDFKNI